MKLYKLTDSNGQTCNGTQWGPDVTHTAIGEPSQPLCSDAWIHAYTDPLLAVLLNPIHANFSSPRLYEAEGEISKTDHGLKVGCRTLTTTKRLTLPEITTTQKIAFAILCAREVYKEKSFTEWSDNWLSGGRAAYAARAAARAAHAACAAAYAARAAARAARAANAAAYAARAAARAAHAAYAADFDLASLAQEALKYSEAI